MSETKLGVLVDNIGKSAANLHLFSSLMQINAADNFVSIDVFYNNMSPPFMNIPYSLSHFSEAWCYNGNILATSISNMQKLLLVPFNGKRIFYVWELEWIEKQINYNDLESVFQNDKVKLITRSDYYKKIIEKTFGQQNIKVIDKFNISQLLGVVNE